MKERYNCCPECKYDLSNKAFQSLQFCPSCRFPMAILEGGYRLEKRLDCGGVGVVYLATQLSNNKQCVVKTLHHELSDDEKLITRFQREIRVTLQISQSSDNIIDLFAHHRDPYVGPFYVMEYLPGESLQDFINQKVPFTFHEIHSIMKQVCGALRIAHNAGVIHRDLKPGNIFLTRQPDSSLFAKLLDFGLAKSLQGTFHADLTSGSIGTPHYMSPEQCLNQEISVATDIYALGVMLFVLVTGQQPFDDESITSLMYKHITQPVDSLNQRRPNVSYSLGLNAVIQKAMAKDPQERYSSVSEFLRALQPLQSMDKILNFHPVPSTPKAMTDTIVTRPRPKLRARPRPRTALLKQPPKEGFFLWFKRLFFSESAVKR